MYLKFFFGNFEIRLMFWLSLNWRNEAGYLKILTAFFGILKQMNDNNEIVN